jgi:hypothetical protein
LKAGHLDLVTAFFQAASIIEIEVSPAEVGRKGKQWQGKKKTQDGQDGNSNKDKAQTTE